MAPFGVEPGLRFAKSLIINKKNRREKKIKHAR